MNIISNVSAARQNALDEKYSEALTCYQQARIEVEREIENCHNPDQNKNWTNMLFEIDAEVKAIRGILNANDQFFSKIKTELPPPKYPDMNLDGTTCDPPIQVIKNDKRPVAKIGNRAPSKKPMSKASSDISPKQIGNAQNMQRRPVVNARNAGYGNKNQKPAHGGIDAKKPAPPKEAGKNQKPAELDPSTNPLVQQIVDMGILIKEPDVSWDSIAGLADVKRLLRKNLVIYTLRPEICKGLLSPWKSVLFYGPPGTGKTFLAKAVATECKRTFFNITSATITSRFLGESEKLVTFLFQLAEQMAPSTIFFDEIDSIASQRGTSNEGESARRMKAQLLTNIEGIGSSSSNDVFVMAATNFPWDLDEALLRRFQKRIYIPLPDEEGRKTILKMKMEEFTDDTFDFDGWANKLQGYSCADIANLCRDAAQMVFDRKTDMMDTQAFLDMQTIDAQVIVSNDDFKLAVAKRKSSVDPQTLANYEKWRDLKGAE